MTEFFQENDDAQCVGHVCAASRWAASPATVALTPTEFDGVSAVGDRNLVSSRRPDAPHGIDSER
ncbi:hypothetical protein E4U52_001597 [Claviceps spartinae]|nr:hypothetical protein E4U52_001597 [Claviceps spartinae]